MEEISEEIIGSENVRQYEKSFAEDVRQFDAGLAEQKRQHDDQMSYNWSALNKKSSGGSGGSGGSGSGKIKSATESQMKNALDAYNSEGMEGLNKYLNSVPDTYDKDSIAQYVGEYGELPLEQRTYTKTKDTWNGLWGIDNNDKKTKI